MFTVKVKLPGMHTHKIYGFVRAKDAEKLADEFQAVGISSTLGHQNAIMLDDAMITKKAS